VPRRAIEKGLAATRWPGRLELVRSAPQLFLDGAHNAAGAAALAAYIKRFHAGRRVWMIFGAMRDKDLGAIAASLFPLAHELILTAPHQTRAFTPAELVAATGATRAHLIDEPSAAVGFALREAAPEDVIFLTGSLYLVGAVRGPLVPVG
jgi:dihydrofolate synthase/folylpolyglutamate synthase